MHPEHALIAAMLVASIGAAHAEVPLVAEGQARAVIIVPTEPAPVAQYAAEELAYHVERATGAGARGPGERDAGRGTAARAGRAGSFRDPPSRIVGNSH